MQLIVIRHIEAPADAVLGVFRPEDRDAWLAQYKAMLTAHFNLNDPDDVEMLRLETSFLGPGEGHLTETTVETWSPQ